jgi:hypothetical protein
VEGSERRSGSGRRHREMSLEVVGFSDYHKGGGQDISIMTGQMLNDAKTWLCAGKSFDWN